MSQPTDRPAQDARSALLSRRTLLQAGGVSATAIALGVAAPETAEAAPPPRGDLFGLGVAAGTPRHDGMVLWTRLAPEPLAADGHGGMPAHPVAVHWEVALDEGFRRPVAHGTAMAQPELAHSVHPEVTGLAPATEHFYRFRSGRSVSPVGRFRTLPAPGAAVDRFSFGFASCQAWYHGHFTAWKHMVEEKDLDLIVFVGDYIYEYGIREGENLWRAGATVDAPHQVGVETLEQYRLRYSLFKTDPHLQAAHARSAMVVTWDDHEVENNYAGTQSQYGVTDEDFVRRIAVAYRAYYENLPVGLDALPDGPHSRIHDAYDIGALARLVTVDTRQHRDPVPTDEASRQAEDRSMLGAEQERWLADQMHGSSAQWNILANSVTVAPIADTSIDQWDGYPAARRRLLDLLADVSDPVVLTGDIHRHAAAELWADPTATAETSRSLGVELICTSVASDGDGKPGGGSATWLRHPYVKAMDSRRGYVHVSLTPEEMTSTFVVVDHIEADDRAPRDVAVRFRTPSGSHRLLPA